MESSLKFYTMFSKFGLVLMLLLSFTEGEDLNFTYNGMRSANLNLDGVALVTPSGLLALTNGTLLQKGHAFYRNPINFKNSSNEVAFSFSTTFVFAIVPVYPNIGGHGFAFVLAPRRGFPGALASEYLGLFNATTNGQPSNHVVAVEFDVRLSPQFNDTNDNHVGVDINSLRSNVSRTAGYHVTHGGSSSDVFRNLSLISGSLLQAWVEYDGMKKCLNVTLAPINMTKPGIPLISAPLDISPFIAQAMYVGFSAATGSVLETSHYILGWSFRMNGVAEKLDVSQLPKLPRKKAKDKKLSKILSIALPLVSLTLIFSIAYVVAYVMKRKKKFAEVIEEWELDYRAHRFEYKVLYKATKGFGENELLGSGGFGKVYRGVLPTSKLEVAVKRISHESRQGIREFVAEIVSIGRLRHRHLVTLLGYCRRDRELLLVYDYMPNGSLDMYLHDQPRVTLNWAQRFRVINGVASALYYLHCDWEKVVVHRDVKASNVLLDGELNARLGDFGLARLYDHGTDPQTTHVVGTLGYLAPELGRTGRANAGTDVFAFGGFLLEVACGRRPIELRQETEADDFFLVDWVFSCWESGHICEASDRSLCGEYVPEEMEMVLKLGLICSQFYPASRPSMRQVVQYLKNELSLPELPPLKLSAAEGITFVAENQETDDFKVPFLSSSENTRSGSLLSRGF